jgi:hypothetical protein
MSSVARLIRSIRKYGWSGFAKRAAIEIWNGVGTSCRRWRDHHGKSNLEGKPKGAGVGIFILAGYKPSLWPLTLERIRRYAPSTADICVVTAGKRVPEIGTLCAKNGWTYLSTSLNKTGLALNKAIEAHPHASRLFKLDEDVFVAEGFFKDLADGYDSLRYRGSYEPGFCAPMLNVNGISYAGFLEYLDAKDAYFQEFGEIRVACDGVRAHHDPKAAEWLWLRSLPFDSVAAKIRQKPATETLIGSRFSIGAIYFERSFWRQIGGFASTWRQGILGIDESSLCTACVLASRPMFYLNNVFAGHFSFYPQERSMLDLIPRLASIDPTTFDPAVRSAE